MNNEATFRITPCASLRRAALVGTQNEGPHLAAAGASGVDRRTARRERERGRRAAVVGEGRELWIRGGVPAGDGAESGGGGPPEALPCPRSTSPRAQPIRLVSHEPLLKPSMKMRFWSTQKPASTAASAASKKSISGEGGDSVMKQSRPATSALGLKPSTIASDLDAS
jgi:hypothetical protein